MNNIVQFNDHNIQIIERTNQLWLSSGDIALALGYEKTKSITNHKEEFDGMSEVIDSVTSNSMSRRQRIFNREGAWLIGMFARTPKAAEFRKWVLKVLGTVVDNTQPEKQVIVSEHTRSLPSGKKEIVLSEKAKTEIGGIVKSVLQAEITQRENIRDVLREVIREEIAPYLLKDGIKEGTFNTSPTADGLPAVNWVVGISHGATALYNLIQQYQKCLREKNDLLLSENADLKNRMKQISSWVR